MTLPPTPIPACDGDIGLRPRNVAFDLRQDLVLLLVQRAGDVVVQEAVARVVAKLGGTVLFWLARWQTHI